ncbi:MAG: transcriptional regulator, ArsR family [Solirubrobacterales bacterium]|nr:transcriptional regulator, ArsR family [Solirubrobacterales bacterium]
MSSQSPPGPVSAAAGTTLDPRLVKALAHPLRFRVLWRLNEVVASPKELAAELGVSLPKLSYHVRVLYEVGAIELVRETRRRGAIEHHYRALTRAVLGDEDWARLPLSTRGGVRRAVFAQAFEDLRQAVDAGTVDARADWHVSHTTLALDETAWAELGAMLVDVVSRALVLQSESDRRLANGQAGGPEVPARLTVMLYEAAPTPAPAAS